LFDVEQNSLDAATRMYTSLFGNVVRAQTEMLRFLSARFAKDALMLEQFGACKGPADVAQLQVKLGSDVITDYFAETQRLVGLFERAAGENLAQAS
ncbi:MAG TPA: phasin family protein, partial [Dokdonella sp.]